MMYKEGSGMAKNPTESRKWLKLAADRGQEDARKELGQAPPPPPPAQKPIVPPTPITPEMRIATTDAPGPATQGAKSAGKCNPDCADMAIFATKLASASAADAKACRDRCLATNKCTGWSYMPKVNICDLTQAASQLVPWTGSIAGTVSRGN
jgi:hypothetical protein